MTHVELIDEGYCSSKRASLSYWDGMDFNSYDLGGQLAGTDLEQAYFGDQPINIDPAQLAAVERAYGCAAPEVYGQAPVWKAATPVSGPYSLTSSVASLTSGHEAVPVPQPVAYNQPAWCGIQNVAALPPLQRSSTAPLPLFAQEFAQPAAVGWAPHAAAGRQHSLNSQAGPSGMQPGTGPGPSGMHFGPMQIEEHTSRPMVVNSPVSNASEPISSPGSVASGALQQPLSPSDERRLRNNEASRRSRQNQKTKNEELQIKLYQLELENLSLKKNIDEVTKMVKYMKEKLVEYMQSKS